MRRHLVHNSRADVGVTPNAVHSVDDDEHQGRKVPHGKPCARDCKHGADSSQDRREV